MMRYAVYARKSSESEDRQMSSLGDQKATMRDFSNARNLHVIEEFEEAKSAKAPGMRPVFEQLLKMVEQNKVDAILCFNISRLTRNPVDGGRIAWLLQQGILKEILTPDRRYLPADNALLLAVETSVANQYVLDLSKNIKSSLYQKAKRGWYPGKPKPGYKTNPDTGETVADDDRYDLLQQALRKLLTTAAPAAEVYNDLVAAGFTVRFKKGPRPLTRSGFYRLLADPFYYGDFAFGGEVWSGRHEPMITRAEWDRIQQRIGRMPYVPAKTTFTYAGLIKCGVCGCQVTGERKLKGNPKNGPVRVYTYYHCTGRRGCPRDSVTEAELDGQITRQAARCAIDRRFGEHLLGICERVLKEEPQALEARIEIQRERRDSLRSKQTGLLDLRLSGEISKDEFAEYKEKLIAELGTIEVSITQNEELLDTVGRHFRNRLSFASTDAAEFEAADSQRKKEIAALLAEEYILNGNVLELKLDPVLAMLQTFEPNTKHEYMVRMSPSSPPCPVQRAVRDAIRTLLLEEHAFK